MATSRLLSQALSLKPYRAPNTFAWVGSSRIAAQFLDGATARNKGNAGWMNWCNGNLVAQGKPMITLGNFGTSGFRTDQYAPGVASAIATNASFIVIDGPVNDFAQQFPTAGTTVSTALSNLKTYFKTINDNGQKIIYVWERGATNFTSTMIGNLNDFNRLMSDYIQYGDDFRGPPDVVVLDPTLKSVSTSTNGTISIVNSVDGTHDNVTGAQTLGTYFTAKLSPYLREIPGHSDRFLSQAAGIGVYNIFQSPGNTGAVAAAGTGNTGTVPTNSVSAQSGLATAVYSTQASIADSNGNTWGNDVKIIATATGVGQVSLIYTLNRTNIVTGDFIRGGLEIDVAPGATGLSGVGCDLEWFPSTGGTNPMYDMFASAVGTDVGGYSNFVLEPQALPIPAFTGSPFTNLALRVNFSAAGSATILVRKGWAERATH